MMGELLRAVLEASLSAAVMILAVLVLRLRFQDRTPRRAFCLLWDMVLARLLVPGALPSPVSIRRWVPLRTYPAAGAAASQPATVTAVAGTKMELAGGAVWQVQTAHAAEDALQFVTVGPAPAPVDRSAVWAWLWLGVALLLAAGFLWSHLRGRKIYASSLPVRDDLVADWLAAHPLRRPVQVRCSDRIAAPLTYGVLYPVILLPRGVDWGEDLPCVLAHEHEHIRRFDALRKPFLAGALCLHWFNPLVWAMYALANRDIELACDEAVLRGGADREKYALALLRMEEQCWSPSASHFSGHALEERIRAIMKRKHISITALAALLVVMSITTTVFASAAPEGGSDQNPPQTAYLYDHLQTVEDVGISILSKGGEDGGKLYSVDGGESWIDEERYHAEYGSWGDGWQVEWWTYEAYKAWLEQEKEDLESIIGEKGWTPSTGWFTWDRERVDQSIALYEEILEKIKDGALYSKTIVDKNGNAVEDISLGSDAPLEMIIGTAIEKEDFVFSAAAKAVDGAVLLEELRAFGIGGTEALLTYNGQLVRYLVDGVAVGDNGYSIAYVYHNDQGTVDLHTVRSVFLNPDGSYNTMGGLRGVAAAGDENFDRDLIDCAAFSAGPQETTVSAAQGGSAERGTSFEEIFARYEEFGLTYLPREGGMGALRYNNLPVRSFADLKPDGGAFSYEDPCEEDGLKLYIEYDRDGNLTGLLADPILAKNIDLEKRELGFAFCTPVQGTVTAGFGQGRLRFHYGVDVSAEKGTDIAAFAAGTVSETGFSADRGSYVVLAHADGYTTLYAHCQNIAVAAGDSVSMGQKIAEVGATGMVTGPALHFELRSGDTCLDPAAYLELGA